MYVAHTKVSIKMLFKLILFCELVVAISSNPQKNPIEEFIKQIIPHIGHNQEKKNEQEHLSSNDQSSNDQSKDDVKHPYFLQFFKKNNHDVKDSNHKNSSISDRFDSNEDLQTSTSQNHSRECVPSETYVGGERQCRNDLILYDDFQNITTDIWNVENIFAGAPDYEFSVYVDFPDTLHVTKSNLVISPGRTENLFDPHVLTEGLNLGKRCTGREGVPECEMHPEGGFIVPKAASARINTNNKFSFKYGNVEIKAKLPAGDWIYPILYLNPSAETYGKYYESGQIRIAFTEGNQKYRKILQGGLILGDSDAARHYFMKNLTSNHSWTDSFHRYQLQWTHDSIVFSVDDQVYNKINALEGGFSSVATDLNVPNAKIWKKGSKLAPFDKEMYLQIGLGIGGLNIPDRKGKPWKNRERLMMKKFYDAEDEWLTTWDEGKSALKIDYVKVWAL